MTIALVLVVVAAFVFEVQQRVWPLVAPAPAASWQNDRWLCPNGLGFVAGEVAGTASYYFPNYTPQPGRDLANPRCFSSGDAARFAHYQPAPPTAGGIYLGNDIYLAPPPSSLEEACHRAALKLGFAVPCPGLVVMYLIAPGCPSEDLSPKAGGQNCVENSAAGNPGAPDYYDTFTFQQNDMALPPTYVGTASAAGHLWVIGVRDESTLFRFRTGCDDAGLTEPGPTLLGRPSTWVECRNGNTMHSGHTLLRWQIGGITYVVSLHGHSSVNREIIIAIAEHLAYVQT